MSDSTQFRDLGRRFLPVLNQSVTPEHVYVSNNTKTGVSINLPIFGTCNPTAGCMKYCYALRGPMVFGHTLVKLAENFNKFAELEGATQEIINSEALRIASTLDKKKRNWIRWNGSGDLIPGSVRVINALATLRPDVAQWIVSRKPEICKTLVDSPAIRLLVSTDVTTPQGRRQKLLNLRKFFKKTVVRVSYCRSSAKRVPAYASIIFNEHIGRKKNGWGDKRTCKATMPGSKAGESCESCRRCFAAAKRQKQTKTKDLA